MMDVKKQKQKQNCRLFAAPIAFADAILLYYKWSTLWPFAPLLFGILDFGVKGAEQSRLGCRCTLHSTGHDGQNRWNNAQL